MQNFILKLKSFNSRHKKLVPFVIPFEILAIIVASIYKNMRKVTRILALCLAVILVIVLLAKHYIIADPKKTEIENEDTVIVGETASIQNDESGSTAVSTEDHLVKTEDDSATEMNDVILETEVPETTESITETEKSENTEGIIETEKSETYGNIAKTESSEPTDVAKNVETQLSDDDIVKFMKENQESIGWIWFEDDIIDYPIMQADDNEKYALKDYQGADSDTGAIFMDYRSSKDLNDSNTIIYGHNMRDRSMFGALKYYKEDLGFLENHKYFQIITPEGRRRYMIFAFMDVPKNSYIYDVIGQNPANMRDFLDTIEYKTYIDTGIEPTVDDKIITLSTCTQSDDLYFVMFAVEVETE